MTAVEWLIEQMMYPEIHNPYIEQALEMEKQQIIDAYQQGFNNAYFNNPLNKEEYYNETFKKK